MVRSPEAALLCHVFTLRFGSDFEGISEPWEAPRVVLGLCICVLLIHYGIQKAKVKLGQRNSYYEEVLKTEENRQNK